MDFVYLLYFAVSIRYKELFDTAIWSTNCLIGFRRQSLFDLGIVSLVVADPNIILTPIDKDSFTGAFDKLFMGIPKNLISAMSAFILNVLFSASMSCVGHT